MSETHYCKECGTAKYYGDKGYHDFVIIDYDTGFCSTQCVNKFLIKKLIDIDNRLTAAFPDGR